jgi:hypothetical protein
MEYIWTQECQEKLDTLKEKLVTAPVYINEVGGGKVSNTIGSNPQRTN